MSNKLPLPAELNFLIEKREGKERRDPDSATNEVSDAESSKESGESPEGAIDSEKENERRQAQRRSEDA